MKNKINLIEETNRMRDLFGYKAGKVISEQLENKRNIQEEENPNFKDYEGPVGKDFMVGGNLGRDASADLNAAEKAKNDLIVSKAKNDFARTPEELSKLKGNTKVLPPKTVAQIQIPKELVDVNGVKKFQEWLNTQTPTWVNGKTLEFDSNRGYGRFGPLTSASWNKLKDIYLKEIGSLQANQKVVANPELATTAVAPAQAAKITEPAPAPAPAAGLTAGQQTNLNRIGQQLQTPEQKRAAELAQKYGQK